MADLLLLAEFALAVAGRRARPDRLADRQPAVGTRDQRFERRLMEHAATLDLEDFEDAEFQDQLERARRQTSGRMTLMAQLFGQAQDIVTVASFAAGLIVYAPWLIVLLLRRAGAGVPRAKRISTRRAIRSTSAARRSGASSTMSGRPRPASRPPRK